MGEPFELKQLGRTANLRRSWLRMEIKSVVFSSLPWKDSVGTKSCVGWKVSRSTALVMDCWYLDTLALSHR
jgi:hypothetical protein